MEFTQTIPADVIRDAPAGVNQACSADVYQGVRTTLYYKKVNDGFQICFGIKVEVPPSISLINVNYKINMIKLTDNDGNEHRHRWQISSQNLNYDSGNGNGGRYGTGPFGLDYGHIDVDNLLTDQYVDQDGNITIIYSFSKFHQKLNQEALLKRMYEKMFPDEVKVVSDQLREENLKLTTQVEKLVKENEYLKKNKIQKEKEYADSEAKSSAEIEKAKKENNVMRETTAALRSQLLKAKEDIGKMEKSMITKEFDQLLMQFSPESLNVDRPLEELKQIQKKGLELQIRISKKILEEEHCAVCHKKRKTYAFKPCGDLYFCSDPACRESKIPKNRCPICQTRIQKCVRVAF